MIRGLAKLAGATPTPIPLAGPSFAIVGARVLDGLGGPPVEGSTIVVEHGRIAAVGPDGSTPLPHKVGAAQVVDVGGATVVPGLVDAHIHLAFARPPAALAWGGVTAARDLGWPAGRLRPLVAEAWRGGTLVTWAGRMLTAPGGYPSKAQWAPQGTAREVTGIDDALRAVDEQVLGGASIVKVALDDRVGPILGRDVLTAIVERADEWGREVTAHLGSAAALELALDARVGELAHVPFRTAGLAPGLIDVTAAEDVVVVPTLRCRDGDHAHQHEAVAFLARFVGAGGAVAYGTDLGNAHTSAGGDPRELQLLAAAGLDAGQVLVAATSGAAARLGPGASDLVGQVTPGRRADLLVLAPGDDPLDDLSALVRPRLVIAGGVVRGRPRWRRG